MPRRIALIMAGGGGTRLWPASTAPRPKQLLDPLLGTAPGDSPTGPLVAQTVARLAGIIEPADVWVVVAQDQLAGVRAALADLPHTNFVAEPSQRNTAPCIALALAHIRSALGRDAASATVLALPADHHVRAPQQLRSLLTAACVHAEAAQIIVTLGIEPDHPATGFGYLQRAATRVPAIDGDGDTPVFAAVRFVEKPNAETAQRFVDANVYLWNAGIFVMPLSRIESELRRLCPGLWGALEPVRDALQRSDATEAPTRLAYASIASAPVDVAVMEKQPDLRVIPAAIGWTDLGSWRSVHAIGTPDAAGNVRVCGAGARAVVHDSSDTLVWSEDATVAVLGVTGLAVIVSGGRVLVCPLHRAEEVKALLAQLDASQVRSR